MAEPRPARITAIRGDVAPLSPAEQLARHRAGLPGTTAAYRPYRNDMPAVPRYTWRARTYPWAQRVLAAAQAQHGPPRPVCVRCGRPMSEARSALTARCGDCDD